MSFLLCFLAIPPSKKFASTRRLESFSRAGLRPFMTKMLPLPIRACLSLDCPCSESATGCNSWRTLWAAKSPSAVAGIEDAARKLFAVQFHPEVRHTKLGTEILRNFVLNVCDAKPTWTPQLFVDATVAAVRKQVGDGRAICALSGGVDSAVAATLVDRALRDGDKSRLTSVFVNNGVLRKTEFEKVQQNLREKLGLHVVAVDATDRFLSKLAGVTDPEKKRKIIGNEFIAVFDEEAQRIEREEGNVDWLVQGTLYPDVIESVSVS